MTADGFAGVQVVGSPRLGTTGPGDRSRRGTKPYETAPDLGHRPTEVAGESGALPASSAVAAWSGGVAGRAAEAVAESFPERARVDTGSSTFGRYRLLERLGEGGMAELYTAVLHGAEGFRRLFVVKRLRPHIARNRAAVEQFIDEAKLGSSLVHSNIVPVFDFGKVNDEYFLAQEYIVGRDLGRLLERHVERTGRPLPERLALYIVYEVLEALAYAHSRTDAVGNPIGLVHRDISPGNVMVTSRGEVKLFDFGIVEGGRPRLEDRGRRREGQRVVHVARAGARAGRRRALRSVFVGAGDVLRADQRTAVPGREHVRSADEGRHRVRRPSTCGCWPICRRCRRRCSRARWWSIPPAASSQPPSSRRRSRLTSRARRRRRPC